MITEIVVGIVVLAVVAAVVVRLIRRKPTAVIENPVETPVPTPSITPTIVTDPTGTYPSLVPSATVIENKSPSIGTLTTEAVTIRAINFSPIDVEWVQLGGDTSTTVIDPRALVTRFRGTFEPGKTKVSVYQCVARNAVNGSIVRGQPVTVIFASV